IVVVDVQDVRQGHGAGDGREHQLAWSAAPAGDVHVQQAGPINNPRPRNSECRGQKVENGWDDSPARAAEEPRPTRVDDAIRRRLRGLRQSGQEIAHLPPDTAAVLQAAGTKHENADRWRRKPITGMSGGSKDSWPADQSERPPLHQLRCPASDESLK